MTSTPPRTLAKKNPSVLTPYNSDIDLSMKEGRNAYKNTIIKLSVTFDRTHSMSHEWMTALKDHVDELCLHASFWVKVKGKTINLHP